MEKTEPVTANPKGVCEKLFNALTINPSFRSFRRITTFHSQDPLPAAAIPNPSPTSPHLVPIGYGAKSSLNSPNIQKLEQVKDPQHVGTPEKKKVEVVITNKIDPLLPPSPLPPPLSKNEKDKPKTTPHEKIQIAKYSREIDLAPTAVSMQGLEKHKNKVDTETSIKATVPQGKEKVAGEVEPPETKGDGGRKGATIANINEKATNYIARAKFKIRSSTNLGRGGGGGDGGGGRTTSFK